MHSYAQRDKNHDLRPGSRTVPALCQIGWPAFHGSKIRLVRTLRRVKKEEEKNQTPAVQWQAARRPASFTFTTKRYGGRTKPGRGTLRAQDRPTGLLIISHEAGRDKITMAAEQA